MPVWETLLVFVGIPLGVVAVLALAVYGRAMVHQPNRYRPGRPWTYEPSWFLPHPEAVPATASSTQAAISGSTTTTAVGGASGEW